MGTFVEAGASFGAPAPVSGVPAAGLALPQAESRHKDNKTGSQSLKSLIFLYIYFSSFFIRAWRVF
jgi:hypothetical protein